MPKLSAVEHYALSECFVSCNNLQSIQIPSLSSLLWIPRSDNQYSYTFISACNYCTSLSHFEFSELSSIPPYGLYYMFYNCSNLTNVDFPKLKNISWWGLERTFKNCKNLSTIIFPELSAISEHGMFCTFVRCENLKDIYFPNLVSVHDRNGLFPAFLDMLNQCSNVSVHYSHKYESHLSNSVLYSGGNNTSYIFDLD